MKKIFLIFTVVMTIMVSCSKDETACEVCQSIDEDIATIDLKFQTDGFSSTRAFFDDVALAEPWEKEVRDLTVYIFDLRNKQKAVFFQRYYPSSPEDLNYVIELPLELIGVECELLAIANNPVNSDMTYDEVLDWKEYGILSSYQSTFSSMINSCIRSRGFSMSGRQNFTLESLTQKISVELKRTVAKLAAKTQLNPDILTQYNVKGASIGLVLTSQMSMKVFADSGYGGEFQRSQIAEFIDGEYCNLFYLYPNLAETNNAKLRFLFVVTLDEDGDPETTNDRKDYLIYHPAEYSGGGNIIRNGYYRMYATINKLQSSRNTGVTDEEWVSSEMVTINFE